MFGPNCFARPRPMPHCGMMPAPLPPGPILPFGGGCHVTKGPAEVVVEPSVLAAPNVFHHHKHVDHIVPVVTQDVHHYHAHHNYTVKEQKQAAEVLTHNHGLCGPAVARPAEPCGPAMPTCGY